MGTGSVTEGVWKDRGGGGAGSWGLVAPMGGSEFPWMSVCTLSRWRTRWVSSIPPIVQQESMIHGTRKRTYGRQDDSVTWWFRYLPVRGKSWALVPVWRTVYTFFHYIVAAFYPVTMLGAQIGTWNDPLPGRPLTSRLQNHIASCLLTKTLWKWKCCLILIARNKTLKKRILK